MASHGIAIVEKAPERKPAVFNKTQWLKSLKKDDEVVIRGWALGAFLELLTVERTTKSMIVLSDGRRFNRNDGLPCLGEEGQRVVLYYPTDRARTEVKKRQKKIKKTVLAD